jgi:pimeloyl-ACP methyl ester carboxylesterase
MKTAPRRWWHSLSAVLMAGCVPLTRYDEIVDPLPPSALLEVAGQRVHVKQWGSGSESLVLLDGFASSIYTFEKFAPQVARGRRVVAIDLNGFGLTERPEAAEAYSLSGQARLVLGVMDRLDIDQADILGHSYGAALAMTLAHEHPKRVGRLLLVSPALDLDVEPSPWLRWPPLRWAIYPAVRFLLSQPRRFEALLARAYHREGVLTAEVAEAYRNRLLVEGLGDTLRGFGAAMRGRDGSDATLGDLSQPTQIVMGRQDRIVAPELVEQAVEGTGIGLHWLEDCGHSVPEEQPARLAEVVASFLGK